MALTASLSDEDEKDLMFALAKVPLKAKPEAKASVSLVFVSGVFCHYFLKSAAPGIQDEGNKQSWREKKQEDMSPEECSYPVVSN